MSKKQRRLQTFSENPGKRPKAERGPKESFTLRDKLLLFAPILGVIFLMIVLVGKSDNREHEAAIRKRVEKWKSEHSLTESTATKLFNIEKEFHQYHSFFSSETPPTSEETTAHDLIVEKLLGTDETKH